MEPTVIENNNNEKSLDTTIQLCFDEYLRLISSQIVLKSITNAISVYSQEKKNVAWDVNFKKLNRKNVTKNNNFNNNNNNNPIRLVASATSRMAIRNEKNNGIKSRKYFNNERWHCISRPQYKYSCGISSLVSCWNYLYSVLGHGKLEPLTHENALKILGFQEPFNEIRFGPFTGNATLMRWFGNLNEHFGVNGTSSFLYKPCGAPKTVGITDVFARKILMERLKLKNYAFIYHCYNHYCCPIGYEAQPEEPNKVYEQDVTSDELVYSFLVADTSRKYPSIHCFKWEDISKDLNSNGEYINIRQLDKGVIKRSKPGRNLHCIIMFQSSL